LRGRRWLSQLWSPTSFTGHVVHLAGWTAVSQVLYVVALPALSRIYAVDTFGNLAVLQSVSMFTIVIASLRYEAAVLLPAEDETAANLLAFSFFLLAATTGALVVAGLAISPAWLFRGQLAFLRHLWWLIPVTHFGGSIREALTQWAIRRKAFPVIGRTKITQVASQLVAQLGMGIARVGPIGLYAGDVVGRVAGAGTLLRRAWSQDAPLLASVSARAMWRAAVKYRSFPLFSTWAQMLSRAGRDFVPIAVAALYGAKAAGWFALASRVLAAPLELISRAVSQVYMGEASELSRVDPRGLRRLFQLWAGRLTLLALIPSAVLALLGPPLFRFAFGDPWEGAGVYARCMALMLLVQFMHFSLVHTLTILERQSWQLVWDAAVLLAGLGGMVALHNLGATEVQAVLYYSCAMAALFVVHYLVTLIAIERRIAAFETASPSPSR
jgi:O-antigen/teichoic acid export membrane protein